jgi:hypothetical protein
MTSAHAKNKDLAGVSQPDVRSIYTTVFPEEGANGKGMARLRADLSALNILHLLKAPRSKDMLLAAAVLSGMAVSIQDAKNKYAAGRDAFRANLADAVC